MQASRFHTPATRSAARRLNAPLRFAPAFAFALLAMLGVASGAWPVAHDQLGHPAAASSADHTHHHAAHDHESGTPTPLPTTPAPDDRESRDCPVNDLIAVSQTLAAEPLAPLPFHPLPPVSIRGERYQPAPCRIDLTTWSARPPPPCA